MTFNEYNDTYLQLMPFEIQEIIITYVNRSNFSDVLMQLSCELSNDIPRNLTLDSIPTKYEKNLYEIITYLTFNIRDEQLRFIFKNDLRKYFRRFIDKYFINHHNLDFPTITKRGFTISEKYKKRLDSFIEYEANCNHCGMKFDNCNCKNKKLYYYNKSIIDNINYYTFRYNVYTDQTSKLYHNYVDVLSCLTYQELISFKNMLYLV